MLDMLPFAGHTAYVLWRLNPNPVPGKPPLKVPVHHDGVTKHSLGRPDRPGRPGYPPNPAPSMDLTTALGWLAYHHAAGTGHNRRGEVGFLGIGFRPDGTGLACIDVDDCLIQGQWAPHAVALMARFPGALFELSTGGNGLHIWFSYSGENPGRHGKDKSGKYELYGKGQFIAIGSLLPGPQGDACTDHTVAMHQVLAEFWPPQRTGPREVTANDWAEKDEQQRATTKREILEACRVIIKHNTYDYHLWVKIGMRLASLGDEGNELWHEFSSWWDGDYDFDEAEHKWGQLNPDHTDYRALFTDAGTHGWVNPQSKEFRDAREDERVRAAMAGLADGFDFDEPEAYGFTSETPPAPPPRPAARPSPSQGLPSASSDATDVVARMVGPTATADAAIPAGPSARATPADVAVAATVAPSPTPYASPIAPPYADTGLFAPTEPWVAPAGFTPPPSSGPYVGPTAIPDALPALTVVLELDAAPGLNFVDAGSEGAKATLPNIVKAIQGPESNVRVRYDEFLGRIVIGSKRGKGRPLKDADSVRLRLNMERGGFKAIGKELMDSALLYLADADRYDSAIEWGRELRWDGVKRVTMALHRYYGVEDTPYTRACSEYLFTALAGRCMSPGCQADMALIFVGVQGARKTSAVSALAPMPDSFVSLNLGGRDDDTARRLRGKLVGELGEMRGRGERDIQSIREWITRRFESWVEKFEKFETKFPRRLVMIASVNEHEVLDDAEGERRWLPMMVGFVDVEAIEADRDQLWAEGVAMWNEGGVRWQEAERLAKAEHHIYKVHDEYIEKIEAWLAEIYTPGKNMTATETVTNLPRGNSPFTIAEVLTSCIGVPSDRHDALWQKKIGKILRGLGYQKKVMWANGRTVKRWMKTGQG